MKQPRRPIDWSEVRARLARVSSAAADPSPEQARALLEDRARKLARVVEPAPSAGEVLEILSLDAGTERYAVETRYVREVTRMAALTRLPGAREHFLGVTNLRGEILPVAELRSLFGAGGEPLTDTIRLVVLGTERAEVGLLVDRAGEVSLLPRSALLPIAEVAAGPSRELFLGVTRAALVVLDGAALLADRRLYIDPPS